MAFLSHFGGVFLCLGSKITLKIIYMEIEPKMDKKRSKAREWIAVGAFVALFLLISSGGSTTTQEKVLGEQLTTGRVPGVGPLVPYADGLFQQWETGKGKNRNNFHHFDLVNDSSCDGVESYVFTNTPGARDSYKVDVSGIPNNSVIKSISIQPCASQDKATRRNDSELNVFYIANGSIGPDRGGYNLSDSVPNVLPSTTFSDLAILKGSSTQLQVGVVYSGGKYGARLSGLKTTIVYSSIIPPGPLSILPQFISNTATAPVGGNEALSAYTIRFSLEAVGGDVYIEKSAGRDETADGSDGVEFYIEDATSSVYTTHAAIVSASLVASGVNSGDTANFYKISDGAERTFTLNVSMDNLGAIAGFYGVQIVGISFDSDGQGSVSDNFLSTGLEDFETDKVFVDDTDQTN